MSEIEQSLRYFFMRTPPDTFSKRYNIFWAEGNYSEEEFYHLMHAGICGNIDDWCTFKEASEKNLTEDELNIINKGPWFGWWVVMTELNGTFKLANYLQVRDKLVPEDYWTPYRAYRAWRLNDKGEILC